ncbi:DUF4328 domain-containing protein [Streptomyces alfalfae]|uniref:DUF4328 domain-containing protein n=1 Tax=Streptomyces alfalfae TaxID=1642299 RepID=UPI0009A15B0B|nr:DUF4328 domain-containing protein [Streptomyces alfalfae]RXX37854.1 DUF4328 domain-containing protein [Streptomyces alfalfae]RZM83271.1 DUF4328 domain-containing protein [Streptomyces alfalfae]
MLCTTCRSNTATTPEGLCDACVRAAAAAGPPPGPPVPPAAGRPAGLRSPVGLARAVVVLLGVVAAVDVFALWTGTVLRDVMGDVVTGDHGTDIDQRADRADALYIAGGVAQVAALVVTCVVFLVWFHRVRVNAEVFEPHIHRKSRGWAIGGWFVPIVNLWYPRRIAVDIWDASGDRSVALDRTLTLDASASRPPHPVVNAWWTLWVSNLLVSRWATRAYQDADDAEEIKSTVTQLMFSDALDIAAAVAAIVFVLRLTRMQDAKARSGPPPRPVTEPFPAP